MPTAARFTTGSDPGSASTTGSMSVFGGASCAAGPAGLAARVKTFVRVASSMCTSSPIFGVTAMISGMVKDREDVGSPGEAHGHYACPVIVRPSPVRPRRIEDLVDPALAARIDRLDVMSRKVFAGKMPGERRSKRRGRSVEFDDYRPYVEGDDLRHIDWNAFARFDRFFIKLFREDEDLAVHLVLDVSASMEAGTPSKVTFGKRLAMALGYIGLVNQNRVAMTIIGEPDGRGVRSLTPMRGRRSVQRLAAFILDAGMSDEAASVGRVAPPARTMTEMIREVSQSRAGRGVMVVISDFLVADDPGRMLNYLAAGFIGGGFDTTCVQVLSPGEMDPARESDIGLTGDVRLTDVESGRHAEITLTAPLVAQYKRRLAAHCERLRSACAIRRMGHVLVPSDSSLETLLLDGLRRRRLVG